MFFIIIMSSYMLWEENFEVAYKNDQKNSSPVDPLIFCLWFSLMAVFVNSSETTAPFDGTAPPPPPQISLMRVIWSPMYLGIIVNQGLIGSLHVCVYNLIKSLTKTFAMSAFLGSFSFTPKWWMNLFQPYAKDAGLCSHVSIVREETQLGIYVWTLMLVVGSQ